MYVVIDELGHVVGKRDSSTAAEATAREYTNHPDIRGRFDSMSVEQYAREQDRFSRLANAFSAKHMNTKFEDSWSATTRAERRA